MKKYLIFALVFIGCSNQNTEWDINTTSIGYSNNNLPIGSELVDFKVNNKKTTFDQLYKSENLFSIEVENGTYFVRRIILNFQIEESYIINKNETNNFQCWFDLQLVDLDINQIINFNCDEYFPVDNIHSAANGTYFLSTLWLTSSTCDYIINAQTLSVEQKCKAESSEELIDVENIFIPNKELQLYLQNIRLDLER
tara:strand:+ start:102 stop:692 length:591 start_codon:yes stop_codon:yes gene_type:complete